MVPPYWSAAKAHLSAADPVFARIIAAYPDEHLTSKRNVFRTLANAIVGQQISVAAADAIWGRLRDLLAGPVTADCILAQSDEALRAVGLSRRKVEYLRATAEAFTTGGYGKVRWSRLTDEAIRDHLVALRGIGPWTADMVLIFTFNRPDVLPLLDIGVVRCIEKHWNGGDSLSHEEMEEIAVPWAPYRTAATWYLWRELDAEPVAY